MRKLILGALVALLTAGSLSACGGASPTATTVPPTATSVPPTTVAAPATATKAAVEQTAATPAAAKSPTSSSTSDISTTSGSNDPKVVSILTEATQAMKAVTSYHFSMELTGLLTAEGDMTSSGDYQMTAQIMGLNADTVSVGGTTYAKNPITEEWEVQEGSDNTSFAFANAEEMAQLWDGATGMELVGTEDLDGVAMTHLKFSADPSKLEGMAGDTSSAASGAKGTGEIWVGQSDHLIYQMVLTADLGSLASAGTPEAGATPDPAADLLGSLTNIRMVMKMSKFNEPVEIKAPI